MASKTEAIYYASPVWLQNLLVSLMGYRLYRKRYTAPYLDLLAQVRESRCWNRQQRDDYQSEQLHRLIRHCSTQIPYYQQLFAEHGFHHNQFTSLPDLRKLPILDKQTLRARPEAFRSNSGRPYMMQNTSGSTGTPLTLAVNEQTYKTAMALLVDHEEHHGVPFRSRRATFAGRMVQRANDTKPPFARTNLAENQRLYSSYHLNRYTFPYYREDLDRFAPLELIGYPSAICDLASHYLATGTRRAFRPRPSSPILKPCSNGNGRGLSRFLAAKYGTITEPLNMWSSQDKTSKASTAPARYSASPKSSPKAQRTAKAN